MKNILVLSLLFILSFANDAIAQNEKTIIKRHIATLSSPDFHGRGYVFNGGKKAAEYIATNFKSYGLSSFNDRGSFLQPYSFSINAFPNNVLLQINKKVMTPGADFIVHAASSSYTSNGTIRLKTIDLGDIRDSISWSEVKTTFNNPDYGYFLKNADTVTKYLKFGIRSFAKEFPKGLFIVPKNGKMIWTACTETVPGTIITIEDTVLPKRITKAVIDVETHFNKVFNSQNILGYVPGIEKPDSFIVFTAHYDHLGRMGENTLFPGAHDNASGTSLVLYLASYFAEHPQKYSVAFMLFSGEEAGLLGSKHYVRNPIFPLGKIRFLMNLDMTGDATNGITMVNGQANAKEFTLMNKINEEQGYIPKINQREQTQNSDHWPFCEAGVPGVFIFGLGTKGYYHDVFDVAKEISLENIDGLSQLLIDFTGNISEAK